MDFLSHPSYGEVHNLRQEKVCKSLLWATKITFTILGGRRLSVKNIHIFTIHSSEGRRDIDYAMDCELELYSRD